MRTSHLITFVSLLAVTSVAAPVVLAADLAESRPERVGMSSDRLQRISDVARQYIDAGQVTGMVTMVARKGRVVHFEAAGQRGDNDPTPMAKDDLFRIYSMTKPITAVAAMQLYEQGQFQLSDPVSKFVPELKDLTVLMQDGSREPLTTPITMQHLLTHTAGFSYGFDPRDPVDKLYREAFPDGLGRLGKTLDDMAGALGNLPLKHQPGAHWHYSVAVDVTGLIVERLSGQPFDEYLAEHVFAPLGMEDTFFSVPQDKLPRFLPNHYWDTKDNKLTAMGPNSVSSYQNVTLFSGGAGLVSTASDYMRFAEMLRNGGEFGGRRLLSPKTLRYMTMDHLPASIGGGSSGENPTGSLTRRPGFGFGLGFGVVTDTTANAALGSPGEFYWGGAAGTVFWVDPVEDIVAIAMIQLMRSPWPLRNDLRVAVNQSIVGDAR